MMTDINIPLSGTTQNYPIVVFTNNKTEENESK